MTPLMLWILENLAISGVILLLFYILYLTFSRKSQFLMRFYERRRRKTHERKVAERIEAFKIATGMRKKWYLFSSAFSFCLFLVIVSLFLTKAVFFTAVTSDSMRPTFKRGDLVLMQSINTEPSVGDIVMFRRPELMLPVLHRVVAVSENGVRTKGDARAFEDPWVIPKNEIEAKAVLWAGKPIVLENLGSYFILDAREVRIGPYGNEYAFMLKLFQTIKMYGYALFIVSIIGYVILTLREVAG